jgi:hypothetical protein
MQSYKIVANFGSENKPSMAVKFRHKENHGVIKEKSSSKVFFQLSDATKKK